MDTIENDHESAASHEATETVAEMKAKMHQNGDMTNHVAENQQNGDDSISNHVDGDFKEPKSVRGSSPSKHHSSSSNPKHSSSHSSSSKSKDHHHSSSSSKHREGSSSSSKHKDGSSSSKSHHSSSSSSSKHKESSSSSSKHKEGSSSSSSSKHKEGSHSSSSHSKDHKHKSSSSEHKSSSSSDKHKDRPKEGSSSKEGDKHKDRHKEGSSNEKHKEGSSSKEGDKHKDRHKEGHSSSSDRHKEKSKDGEHRSKDSEHRSKHKDGSSHSSSDKHRDKHKDGSSKSKESSSGDKKRDEKHREKVEVKKEPHSPTKLSSPEKSPSKSPSKHKEEDIKMEEPMVKEEPKDEPMSDDDVPLSVRVQETTPSSKRAAPESDDDDEPLSARVEKVKKKIKKEEKSVKVAKKRKQEDSDDEKPLKKKKIKKESDSSPEKGKKKKKKDDEEDKPEVWRWWEEETREDGVKWNYLEHKGPIFAPDYEPLPDYVKFYYDGKPMKLSEETEEVATFYGRMLDHDYTTKDVFNKNFFKDWRKVMTQEEKEKITDLKKCKFHEINDYFKQKSEERKNRSREEKKQEKLKNDEIQKEYGVCVFDGHKEKIGNFKIEPPGLFRGRGEHPKQGMLKKRIQPEDVIINCSKGSKIPQPPKGHKWKEVRHDNKVSWLACWSENIQGQTKYVMLNAASRLKGEKDWQKYEKARELHKIVDKIRENYRNDWKSKEMRIRQRAVALYFIDKLALRAGNEKEEGETADTVGCCSLRVEHITLHEKYDDLENVVEFDFLGKDSIRYYNRIPVEKRAFKNLQLFTENKSPGDDLFDRLNTAILNKHLHDLMAGLTAKVFRTYNASRTLQEQLNLLTEEEDNVSAKMLSYNRANRAVAILCNHQRAVPKNFDKQMENLQTKIDAKKDTIRDAKKQVKAAKADYKATKAAKAKQILDKKKKMLERLEEQLTKLEVQATDKDENKEIALGTSKLNYLDPRISVACLPVQCTEGLMLYPQNEHQCPMLKFWLKFFPVYRLDVHAGYAVLMTALVSIRMNCMCKKWEVPIEKIYNKTQRDKFRWAIDMATEDFQF